MDGEIQRIGYHKTEAVRGQRILSTKIFPVSRKNDEWLGRGIYFWTQLEDAVWWMPDCSNSMILSAKLSCPSTKYMDLDIQSEMETIDAFFQAYLKANKCDIDYRDSYQITNLSTTVYKDEFGILLIHYSFPSVKKNNAGFFALNPIRPQLCATDNSIISKIKKYPIGSVNDEIV